MGLGTYRVRASIAVSDLARAVDFYEARLGLSPGEEQPDESRVYACGDGSSLHVYLSPDHAGRATATLATWAVPDIVEMVAELTANGVTFVRYDDPALKSDAQGIHDFGAGLVAWFKDPDGNTFALEQ
jgi:catechol 2,3-dioxygenase-like lactoylglutathione lyase family enzyme